MARQRERWAPRVLAEIDSVLGAPVPAADPPAPSCCAPPSHLSPARSAEPGERAAGDSGSVRVVLEDQDGGRVAFEEYYSGKPAIVAFFYTRCDNPYKCSRTITGLAALQGALACRGLADAVKVTAITYDPEFDGPARLRAYGRDRGVRFGADARFFRAVTGFAELRRRFDLGVNYGASTVNRHRIEVHLLDGRGAVSASFTRLQWTVDEVLAAVEDVVARDRPGGVAARCRC
jgi:protein SCO1/2